MSVSVIIPFYNSNKYLSKAIESCLIQKEVKEILLVDDGSKDNSAQIAISYASQYSEVKLLSHSSNLGRSAARNTGLQNVKEKYFSFLDADDYFRKERFSAPLVQMEGNTNIDGIYEPVESVTEKILFGSGPFPKMTMMKNLVKPSELFESLILGENGHFSIIGCTFRSSSIKDSICFDTNLEIGEDTDFLWHVARDRILEQKEKQESAKILRTIHGNNTMFNQEAVIANRAKLYKKWVNMLNHPKMTSLTRLKLIKSFSHYTALKKSNYKSLNKMLRLKILASQLLKQPSLIPSLFQ